MNRRLFTGMALAMAAAPARLQANQATPVNDQPRDRESGDTRTRNLVRNLQAISATDLLEALEVAPVTNSLLVNAGDGAELASIPWVDFGDTDLYSSLGGVIIAPAGIDLNSPDAEMVGGYIVYESAEIAYHEFVRKIGPAYDSPAMTSAVAGTNVWMFEANGMQIGTTRIGNVMLLGLVSGDSANVIEGLIEHLADVAENI